LKKERNSRIWENTYEQCSFFLSGRIRRKQGWRGKRVKKLMKKTKQKSCIKREIKKYSLPKKLILWNIES